VEDSELPDDEVLKRKKRRLQESFKNDLARLKIKKAENLNNPIFQEIK
jgi:hypothetical protein